LGDDTGVGKERKKEGLKGEGGDVTRKKKPQPREGIGGTGNHGLHGNKRGKTTIRGNRAEKCLGSNLQACDWVGD